MSLSKGQILQGRYSIVKLLGQGGMGAVYLANDLRLEGRFCAIKEQIPDSSATPKALTQLREQFLTEAKTLAKLDHPNLPKVSDYFSSAGNEYLVMDYIEGQDLASAQQKIAGPLPEKPMLEWAIKVLDALHYLHTHQPHAIIHRDIKPANIILTRKGEVKLVDFGLVKLLDPTNPRTATVMRGMGTPEYTPLEQYASGQGHTDARTDIYAFGATLYHLLTAVAPPDAPQRVIDPTQLIPPRDSNPSLSVATEKIILKAMEIAQDDRYQSALAFREALAKQLAAPPIIIPSPTPSPPNPARARTTHRRRRQSSWAPKIATGVVITSLLLLVCAVGFWQRDTFLLSAPTSPSSAIAPLTITVTQSDYPVAEARPNTPTPVVSSSLPTESAPPAPPTAPAAAPSNTPIVPTAMPIAPAAAPSNTPIVPTAMPIAPAAAPTETPLPPMLPPTNAPVPPTLPPTHTFVPPTLPPTDTPVPPTLAPTDTPVPPTLAPTDTPVPPTVAPTDTPYISPSTVTPSTTTLTEPDLVAAAATNTPVPASLTEDNTDHTVTALMQPDTTALPPTATPADSDSVRVLEAPSPTATLPPAVAPQPSEPSTEDNTVTALMTPDTTAQPPTATTADSDSVGVLAAPSPSATFPPAVMPQPSEPSPNLDPRVAELGVTVAPARMIPGQAYWRVVEVLLQTVADGSSIQVEAQDESGNRLIGQPVTFSSGANSQQVPIDTAPLSSYGIDFPMADATDQSYSVNVAGAPSEIVHGMKISTLQEGEAQMKVQYLITFQRVIAITE